MLKASYRTRSPRTLVWLALLGIFSWAACARVKVQKVPTPSQYIKWTDKMQRKADKMEGLRYYLPRPFINVFESFPIRTDVYIATARLSPDEKYVLITEVTNPALMRHIASPKAVTDTPDKSLMAAVSERMLGKFFELQAEAQKEQADKERQSAITGSDGVRQAPSASSGSSRTSGVTGQNQRAATNDISAYSYQPMRGNMDIAYLPDFEEQYVVSSRAGLGNAQFSLNLGQGWSLQGFNSLSDNSELNKRIFDIIDTSIQAAKAAAAAQGVPISPVPQLPESAGFTPQGEEPENVATWTPVSLKIIVVYYASKGLYPVIKPRELQQRRIESNRGGGLNVVLDMFRATPLFVGTSGIDENEIKDAIAATDNLNRSFTTPRYPYQYISFNTFRNMTLELLTQDSTTKNPSRHLIDKTGTTGEVGDRSAGPTGSYGSPSLPPSIDDSKTPDTGAATVVNVAGGGKVTDGAEPPAVSPDLQKARDELQSKLTREAVGTSEQAAEVEFRGEQLVVRVVHLAEAPATFADTDRQELFEELTAVTSDTDDAKGQVAIYEIPPSKEQLDKIKGEINEELTDENTANRWQIVSISFEHEGKHTAIYAREGDDPDPNGKWTEEKLKTIIETLFTEGLKAREEEEDIEATEGLLGIGHREIVSVLKEAI